MSCFVAWEVKFRLRFVFLLVMFNRSSTMYRKGNISSLEFYCTLVKNQLSVFSLPVYGFLILVDWSLHLFLHQYRTIKIKKKIHGEQNIKIVDDTESGTVLCWAMLEPEAKEKSIIVILLVISSHQYEQLSICTFASVNAPHVCM